jgi:N-acyl-D-aspartate/D-glutamate deacylase
MATYDLLITGGTVVDGTGAAPFAADVAVKDGRIAAIIPASQPGPPPAMPEALRLDAGGLLVAPGFIDIHSHSDYTLLADPRAVSSVAQGVTLEVVGNCGHGCAPIGDPQLAQANIYGYRAEPGLTWRTMAGYLDLLTASRPAVNVLTLVPNGNLRLATLGLADRPATPDELRQMKRLLAESMEAGAFGFSTGLEYGPERACPEEEVVELCRVAAAAGGIYATHTRNRAGQADETIAEAIRAGAAAGLPVQISHIGVVARLERNGRAAIERALEQIARARARGLDISFDMHTRLFGTTNLSAALPPWVLAGDRSAIAARLRDGATRRELKSYQSIITALARGDWNAIVLSDSLAQPELSRRSVAEIAAAHGRDPFDTIYDILLAELEAGDINRLLIIALAYRADDLRMAFTHPSCMVGSDATALAPDGPLADSSFHGAYTWAAWFFRHFTRGTAMLSPQEAVRRLTSLPARRIGLNDRGIVRAGAWADLAIFDPATFAERGTTFEPNQTAIGMRHVLINGVVTLKDGALTGDRGGQVLRST